MAKWSNWVKFPNPQEQEVLTAPFGAGCYELRLGAELVLFGRGSHVAYRLSSLLPRPYGTGTRNNSAKRDFVLQHLGSIEYRTMACGSGDEAKSEERKLLANKGSYRFAT